MSRQAAGGRHVLLLLGCYPQESASRGAGARAMRGARVLGTNKDPSPRPSPDDRDMECDKFCCALEISLRPQLAASPSSCWRTRRAQVARHKMEVDDTHLESTPWRFAAAVVSSSPSIADGARKENVTAQWTSGIGIIKAAASGIENVEYVQLASRVCKNGWVTQSYACRQVTLSPY
ncbi:hypothetical protein EON66_05110, partial [archaeon]